MVIINGTGKVEKFDMQGFHTFDIALDEGKGDFADLLAEHEGEHVTVIVIQQGELNNDMLAYVERQGEKAVKLSEEISELNKKMEDMVRQVDENKADPFEPVKLAAVLTVKNFQLQMIMQEMKAFLDMGVSR